MTALIGVLCVWMAVGGSDIQDAYRCDDEVGFAGRIFLCVVTLAVIVVAVYQAGE